MCLGRVGGSCFEAFSPHLGKHIVLGELPYIWKPDNKSAAHIFSSIPK